MTAAAVTVQSQTDNSSADYNPIKGQTFNPTPRIVDNRKDLLSSAKRVYGYLCGCYGKDGLVCPKVPTIAEQLGLSVPTVTRAIFTLKQKKLIDTIPTGRASRYIFLDPDQAEKPVHKIVDQVSENPPKMIEQVNQNDRAGQSKCDEQEPVTPYIENKSPKEQTTPPPHRVVVVSLGNDEDVQACMDAIPKEKQTPSTKRIVKKCLAAHGRDEVLKAIGYTAERSTKSFGAYLNLCLKKNWHEDWQPPKAIAARQTEDIQAEYKATIEANDTARKQADNRAALAQKWLSMPDTDRATIREAYLQQCSRFELKRARLMDDEKLAASIGFRLFLEGREEKIND